MSYSLIPHDIDPIICNFLCIKEFLTFAILETRTNRAAKKNRSYNALVRQLGKNHRCSFEELIVSTIHDGNSELLDLLVKSGGDPCMYFIGHVRNQLISECKLGTILWFDRKMNIYQDMDELITNILQNACRDNLYLQIIKDHQQIIKDHQQIIKDHQQIIKDHQQIISRNIGICIRIAVNFANFELIEWFREIHLDEVNEYLNFVSQNLSTLGYDDIILCKIVRWLTEHGYLNLSSNDLHDHIKMAIIKDSVSTDIYKDKPIEFLSANPKFISLFFSDIALIHKYEPDLIQFLSTILTHADGIFYQICKRNDVEAFKWVCSKVENIMDFDENIVLHAFEYGCIEMVQFFVDQEYDLGDPYPYLRASTILEEQTARSILKLFETMGALKIDNTHILLLIITAINFNDLFFLKWLFEFYKISARS